MKQKIKTPYGSATVYSEKGGEGSECVVVIPGFSESLTHNKAIVNALAAKGYSAFTFRQPRSNATHDPIDRLADIVQCVLDSTDLKDNKIHAVAHSLGSAPLLKVAQKHPDRFASVILMQPPGIVKVQEFSELIRRTGRKTVRNAKSTIRDRHLSTFKRYKERSRSTISKPLSITTRRLIRSQLSSAYVIAKNPRLAAREALAVIHYDIGPDIAAVRGLRIPVHVVEAHGDELFDTNRDDNELHRIADLTGAFFSLTDNNAPHDTFWLHPQRTAEIITKLIEYSRG